MPARIYGKKIQALVDSGATRCFISPSAVLKCGLRTVPEETVLELADGRKLLSNGVCPNVLISVSTATSRIDLTVSPLLQNVDVILGANWLQMTEPLIDWSVPRLLLPGSDTAATVIGKWLSKEVPVGQIAVLRNFCLPSHPVPPSPLDASLAVLRRPTFWTFASSGNAWAHSSSPGGMVCATTSTTAVTTSTHSDDDQDQQDTNQGHQGQSER